MIICKSCNKSFENNLIFLKHTKLTHSNLKVFQCPESDCQKTYTIISSFCKHRQAKHNINFNKENENI